MYAEHFNLRLEPFGLTPDPAFLYLSPEHREALAAVQYGLLDGRGFITLVGEVGTGKTTLLYTLLGQLGPDIQAAYIAYTTQSFSDMLAAALKDFGAKVTGTSKHELLSTFNALLTRAAEQGKTVALVIDEAQNLTDEAFEELRLLSNFETYDRKLLQIVLVGQPELQDRLHHPRLRQLRERVSVRTFINPLTPIEMRRYIEHRMQRAGGSAQDLFTPGALRMIVRRTQGIPRRANILCHNALLFAFGRNLDRVTDAAAREAIAEMDDRRPGMLRRGGLRRVRGTAWPSWLSLPSWPPEWPSWPPLPSWLVRWASAIGLTLMTIVVVEAVSRARDPGAAPPVAEEAAAPSAVPALPEPVPAPPPAEVVHPDPVGPAVEPPAAATSPPAAPNPVEVAATRADTAKPNRTSGARKSMEPDRPEFLAITVPHGTTVAGLLRDIYGTENSARLLADIRRLNPDVRDPAKVPAGTRLRLPWPPAKGEEQ